MKLQAVELTTCLGSGTLIFVLSVFNGGFYPRAWGWASLAVLSAACAGLVLLRHVALTRREWLALGLLTAVVAWAALNALRPDVGSRAIPEVERGSLYVFTLWAALIVLRRDSVRAALGGVLAGIVAVSVLGLVLYLFPRGSFADTFEGRLLFRPLGYANAFGILTAMGFVLALGFAAHARRLEMRALAAGSIVPLLTALAYTHSRGAEAALVCAAAVVFMLDGERRRLAATALLTLPLPLLAIWLGARSNIADAQQTTSVMAHDGHILAAATAALVVAQIAVSYAVFQREQRLSIPTWVVVSIGTAAACLAVAAVVTRGDGTLGDRPSYWRVALTDFRDHPVAGSGAGSFGWAWLRLRSIDVTVRDAHSLYLETLAELGLVGLLLLVGALAVPIVVAVRRRNDPMSAIACGAFVAYLTHAALDWDWEVPAVTITALLGAAAVLVSARVDPPPRPAKPLRPIIVPLTASVALILAATAALIGNSAFAGAARAAHTGSLPKAERLARRAAWWQPWSAEPRFLLGEIQLAQRERGAARASYRRALELDSRDWRTWYELGAASSGPKRRDAFRHAVRLDPLAVQKVEP